MKGVVFTEFLEMVEEKYNYRMVDTIVSENKLSSDGAYTAVGTYDHSEMVKLIVSLSKHTQEQVPNLLKIFGHYFFDTLKKGYPQFLDATDNAFDFLESIETYIHVEVRKLYPDAELPTFKTQEISENKLEMIYYSERKMSDFAEGLIERSLEYYGEKGTVQKQNIEEDGSIVRFVISK